MDITGTGFWGGGSSSDVEWIRIVGNDGYQKLITTYSVAADTSIVGAVIPSSCHAGTYDIQVSTYSGGNNSTSTQKFTITTTVVPEVTNIEPTSGNNFYATSTLNIYGTGFFGGAGEDDIRDIRLSDAGNTRITKGVVSSDTSIINCIVPSGVAVGTYDVKVTTGGGIATSAIKYIVTSMPEVTGVTPNTSINTVQATSITITGKYFTGIQSPIRLSGPQEVEVYNFNPIDDNNINAVIIPAYILAGTYDVRVSTSKGTNVTSSVKWIETANLPSVNSILPDNGINSSSTLVTITGTGFYGGTLTIPNVVRISMKKGEIEIWLASYSVISDSVLEGIIPSGLLVGTYDVKVSNGGGESTNSVKFRVTTPIPIVSNITPNSGLRTGQTTIEIIGAGFFAGTTSSNVISVKIGDTSLINPLVNSDSQIVGIVPSNLDTGRYPIYVTTTGGINSPNKTFDVLFDNTQNYEFSKNDIKFNIPANTFNNPVALIVNIFSSTPDNVIKADKLKYKNIKIRTDLSSTLREIITNTGENISSGKSLTIRYGYGGTNFNDTVIEKMFRVVRLDENNKWCFVPGEQIVDLNTKEIICSLDRLSIFKIAQYVEAANNLDNVVAYPNPIDFSTGTGVIKFVNLTANPTLKIYTISGELVKEIKPDDIGNPGNDGRIEWDGRNDNGELIKRGLYIYLITDEIGGRKIGKFVVK